MRCIRRQAMLGRDRRAVGRTAKRRVAHPTPEAELHRLFLGQSRDLFFFVDADNVLRAAAGTWRDLLGVDPAALRDHPAVWPRIVHPEDQWVAVGPLSNPAQHLDLSPLSFRAQSADGEGVVWLTARFVAEPGGDGRPAGVVCALREAERACRLNWQLEFAIGTRRDQGGGLLDRCALFDQAGDVMFILEPATLRILECNRLAQAMTGLDAQALRGTVLDQWLGREESKELRRHINRHLHESPPPPWRGQVVGPGRRVQEIEIQLESIDLHGLPVIQCTVRDISEHRQAVRKLLRFEQIMRGISDSTVVCNLAGQVVFANPAAERLWGLAGEAWERTDIWDLYASPIPARLDETGRVELDGERDHAEGEFVIRGPGQAERTVFTSFSLVRDQGQRPIGLVSISRDVTAEKSLQMQLLQVQKMDCIGTLAGGVAHDFNNLLGGILGYAQLIKTQVDPSSRVHSQAEFIENSAVRASQLTQQLLSFSRKGKYNLRVVPLSQVVQGALMLLEGSLPKSILLHTDLDSQPCFVEADVTQLEQVLLNLCINARDAIGQAGWITIRTRVRDLDEAFCRERLGLVPGPHAEIMVKDSGKGIDPDDLPHIFEPFFTTKELGKGTGLGLSVVYGIVKNHGGYVEVKSTPGVGTQFFIYLPATERRPGDVAATPVGAAEGGNERVLVVDDEPTIRELVTDVLKTYGYRILRAKDGVEAIEIYRRNRANISLVLLDMQMPMLNGLQTYRRLREINPGVRVVLSSGYGMDQDIQKVLQEGVLAFIQKPYKIHELARVVRECLDRAPVS